MNFAATKRAILRIARDILLMLSLLWLCQPGATAGELVEASDAPLHGLTLPDLAGQQRSLEEFESKVLLVNFWASWCTPCIEEMPSIQRLVEAMKQKPFAVIGVNVAEQVRRVETTVRRLRLEFPVLLDKDGAVFESWGATVLPSTYVLDRGGRIRHIARGPIEWDRADIIEMLEELMEMQPHVASENEPGSPDVR